MSGEEENDNIAILMSMGFDIDNARTALSVTNDNIDQAINYLLTATSLVSDEQQERTKTTTSFGGGGTPTTSSAVRTIVGSISQYTNENNGRSACTCIALKAAEQFLLEQQQQHKRGSKNDDTNTIITTDFLTRIVADGISIYQMFQQHQNMNNNAEHTSVEDIMGGSSSSLSLKMFPYLSQQYNSWNIRQGILSNDNHHPLGLQCQLTEIMNNMNTSSNTCSHNSDWTCIIMTKTPETVLLCLSSSKQQFVLIDSHPRPNEFGIDTVYCRIHNSLDELIQLTLNVIFSPMADMGPDIPEMMLMMYNSFDLYPFYVINTK